MCSSRGTSAVVKAESLARNVNLPSRKCSRFLCFLSHRRIAESDDLHVADINQTAEFQSVPNLFLEWSSVTLISPKECRLDCVVGWVFMIVFHVVSSIRLLFPSPSRIHQHTDATCDGFKNRIPEGTRLCRPFFFLHYSSPVTYLVGSSWRRFSIVMTTSIIRCSHNHLVRNPMGVARLTRSLH